QLEYVQGALDVGAQVDGRVGERADQGDLAGDVADRAQPAGKSRLQLARAGHVSLDAPGGRWHVLAPAGGLVVEHQALGARNHQPLGQMRADKAGPARHENVHTGSLTAKRAECGGLTTVWKRCSWPWTQSHSRRVPSSRSIRGSQPRTC